METSTKLYDLSMVETISGGDQGFIKKMILLFIETMPQNLEELRQALNNQQWEQMGKLAHKMKSTIDSMGIISLKEVIRKIEASGKNQTELDQVPAWVDKTTAQLNQCIDQLKNDFAL